MALGSSMVPFAAAESLLNLEFEEFQGHGTCQHKVGASTSFLSIPSLPSLLASSEYTTVSAFFLFVPQTSLLETTEISHSL